MRAVNIQITISTKKKYLHLSPLAINNSLSVRIVAAVCIIPATSAVSSKT